MTRTSLRLVPSTLKKPKPPQPIAPAYESGAFSRRLGLMASLFLRTEQAVRLSLHQATDAPRFLTETGKGLLKAGGYLKELARRAYIWVQNPRVTDILLQEERQVQVNKQAKLTQTLVGATQIDFIEPGGKETDDLPKRLESEVETNTTVLNGSPPANVDTLELEIQKQGEILDELAVYQSAHILQSDTHVSKMKPVIIPPIVVERLSECDEGFQLVSRPRKKGSLAPSPLQLSVEDIPDEQLGSSTLNTDDNLIGETGMFPVSPKRSKKPRKRPEPMVWKLNPLPMRNIRKNSRSHKSRKMVREHLAVLTKRRF